MQLRSHAFAPLLLLAAGCGRTDLLTYESCTFTLEASPPRPIAPLSTARAASRRPVFRWELAPYTDGAVLEICATRACTSIERAIDADGGGVRLTEPLAPGVHYWRLRGRRCGEVGTEPGPTWQLHVGHGDAEVGEAFSTALDPNGDGVSDLAVRVLPSSDAGWVTPGCVGLYPGSPAGAGSAPLAILAGPSLQAGRFGEAVASAGDVDGDGFGDVVVGAPCEPAERDRCEGRAYVYRGALEGLAAHAPLELAPDDPAAWVFGSRVSAAGDVNGDGYGDVIVQSSVRPGEGDPGLGWIFWGGKEGPGGAPSVVRVPERVFPPAMGAVSFQFTVAGIGDVDGDGYGDVVAATWCSPRSAGSCRGGQVHVYHGSPGGLPAEPTVTLRAPDSRDPGTRFGQVLVLQPGDVNGDGFADLVVGAVSCETCATPSRIHVYLGGESGIEERPALSLENPSREEPARYGLTILGDVDADGYDDLLVEPLICDGFECRPDGAYLFRGGPDGVEPRAHQHIPPTASPDAALFGLLGAVGDLNGDGHADAVATGSTALDAPGRRVGLAFFAGTTRGLALDAVRPLPVGLDGCWR